MMTTFALDYPNLMLPTPAFDAYIEMIKYTTLFDECYVENDGILYLEC